MLYLNQHGACEPNGVMTRGDDSVSVNIIYAETMRVSECLDSECVNRCLDRVFVNIIIIVQRYYDKSEGG